MISGSQRWYQVAAALEAAAYNGFTSKPTRHGVVPGSIAWDGCDCGLLAVTVESFYPSDRFPRQAGEPVSNVCRPAYEVAEIVLQIIRCAPEPSSQGDPPSTQALDNGALMWAQDAGELVDSVNTQLCQMEASGLISDGLLRPATSTGPEGGCVGVELRVLVGLING